MASKAEKEQGGFEALYKRLEDTVAKLENGGLTLEESLAMYEEGMKLAQRCQALLKDAELRVTKLQESFADGPGAVSEDPPEYDPSVPEATDD